MFVVLVGFFALSCVYDPYADKRAQENFMNMILSRMGLANVFDGF